jgi:hypothetical protein
MPGEQVLPVHPALVHLFPDGLRRGEVVAVEGPASVSCAFAMAAGPSAAGSWTLVAGLVGPGFRAGHGARADGDGARANGDGARVAGHGADGDGARADGGFVEPARTGACAPLGVGAAVAMGVMPERLVVLAAAALDGAGWVAALTAAVDGFDVVVVRPPAGLPPAVWRRLGPRVRDRGGVLIGVDLPGGWERSTTVRTIGAEWSGIGRGSGHLRARTVTLERVGRGAATRPRRAELLLPGPGGAAVAAAPAAAADRLVELPARRVG